MSVKASVSQKWIAYGSLGMCLALLILIHVVRPFGGGLWLDTLFNTAHVPVFMLVALGIFVALRLLTDLPFSKCVAGTLLLAGTLGVLSEAAQIPGPRDASIGDLIADWQGVVCSTMLIIFVRGRHDLGKRARFFWAIAGVGLLVVALQPLIIVSAAYAERNRSLPVLVTFENTFSDTFYRVQHSKIEITVLPSNGTAVGLITFGNGLWPGIVFHDLWPDWSDFSTLVLEMKSDDTETLRLFIRVHDKTHSRGSQTFDDRFNITIKLDKRWQVVRIPLDSIREAPRNRLMDMQNIDGIVIFADQTAAERSFQLAEIFLEK